VKQIDKTDISERVKEFIDTVQVRTNCSIGLVPPSQVPNVWEKILPHIERMAPHSEGELEPDDFFEALTEGDMQLWVAIKDHDVIASMISQIVTYPRKRILRIISIGGDDMELWIDQLPMVEDWALTMGCTSLECWGRKGWLKILKDWKCSYHIITKDLTARMH
jgi:hypothetical protein